MYSNISYVWFRSFLPRNWYHFERRIPEGFLLLDKSDDPLEAQVCEHAGFQKQLWDCGIIASGRKCDTEHKE
jgi:hypothetical protein